MPTDKNILNMNADNWNWKYLYNTLVECQQKLEANGRRHSWIDPAIKIAKKESEKPAKTVECIFSLPAGAKALGICKYRGAIILAATDGVYRITNAQDDELMRVEKAEVCVDGPPSREPH